MIKKMKTFEQRKKEFEKRLDHAIEYEFTGGFEKRFLVDFFETAISKAREEGAREYYLKLMKAFNSPEPQYANKIDLEELLTQKEKDK